MNIMNRKANEPHESEEENVEPNLSLTACNIKTTHKAMQSYLFSMTLL